MYNDLFSIPLNFCFRNSCAATKEKEKRLAKMCANSAKIDYPIYQYIMNDLKIFDWRVK